MLNAKLYTANRFTYHIVNIKLFTQYSIIYNYSLFTYHIVNIKLSYCLHHELIQLNLHTT